MKKLLSLLFFFGALMFVMSCGDDDDDDAPAPTFSDPTVSAGSVGDVNVGGSGTASFTVSVDPDLTANYVASFTGGITLGSTSGAVAGGSVDISFDATTAGAASITLTVTDSESQSANATAVFNVVAEDDAIPTISGIPATATITEGEVLFVPDVTLEAEDGFGAIAVSVDGTDVPELGSDLSGETSPFVFDFEAPQTADFDPGTYEIVFTLTDADGDEASFTHVLIVEAEEVPIAPVIIVEENISDNATWTVDNVYELAGRVTVLAGASLTIEPGTVIKGQPGTGANATALLVARGATINAAGTADAPIIFTSTQDEIQPGQIASPNLTPDINGLWGGVIVLGNGFISASAAEVQIEGIPATDTNGLYGGTDDDENSGTLQYISIRHGGANIGAGNEINGLSLGGISANTVVENIEVVANQDDGIEWFGGSVNVTNALFWNVGDDAVDTDQGWNGTLDNYITVNPAGSAFELDGPEGDDDAYFASSRTPINFTLTNGTIYMGNSPAAIDFDPDTNADLDMNYWYGFTNENDDQEVEQYQEMIDAFGVSSVTNVEVTLKAGATVAGVFVDVPADNITEVAANANTVGVQNIGDFSWTWASVSGALNEIGL